MERFGSNKPNTRFGFELKKLNDKVKNCGFKVFEDVVGSGGDVRGICITGGADIYTRKKIDKLTEAARSYGAGGLVWIKLGNNDIKSSVNKFFDQDQLFDIASEFKKPSRPTALTALAASRAATVVRARWLAIEDRKSVV